MRRNIVSEAGLSTRVGQLWDSIPFFTSAVVIVCGTIYLVCLLTGYDSFYEICFLPSAVISQFQASLAAHNPFHSFQYLMNECAIGFSGIILSMIVIETSLSGVQSRSVFGLFNIPAKLYPWILLVLFQLLMTNVSLLGHLCGILSGFAYTYGLFNFLIPGTSFYSSIEASSWLSTCTRRPKFILCTGGNPSGHIPTYSGQNTNSSGLFSGNIWRNFSSWMSQRETSSQAATGG